MGSPTLELSDGFLRATTKTGNTQWVARLTGPDSKYGFARDFVIYQRQTTEREDSTVKVTEGDFIEVVWKSHGGNEQGRRYFRVSDDRLDKVEKGDVVRAFDTDETEGEQ